MVEADSHLKLLPTSTWYITKCLSTLVFVILLLPSSRWCFCCCCAGIFAVVELAPCPGTVILIALAGLSIEEKDLLFCTCIGIWPLPVPLPSYLCNQSLNGREGPPSDGTSIYSPHQQAHQCRQHEPISSINWASQLSLSWQEGPWNRMWSSMHSMPRGCKWVQWMYLSFFVQSMLLVRWVIIDR